MKICVYAISKNEEKFVNRWLDSMNEADEIYVLDTGSTDNTVKLLKDRNVHVYQKEIIPWRFDVARNESLKLLPNDTDICVCTDLDEVFNKGWRKELENNWKEDTTRARYIYNWSLDENNKPIVSFYYEKIHKLEGFKWIYPVHEVLDYNNKDNYVTIDNIVLNHYPDKTKSRSSYLKLLELSVKENPNNDRNMHYLGREYMFYGEWNKCIDTLKKHLSLKNALWKDERCASMRFISRAYKNLNNYKEALNWLDKAIKEAPYLREAYVEKAFIYYEEENYLKCEEYLLKALKIKNHEKTYINEPYSWNETIYDLLALVNYYQKRYNYAIYFNNIALSINPNNERLINNQKYYIEKEQL